jgi:hypothetical protein
MARPVKEINFFRLQAVSLDQGDHFRSAAAVIQAAVCALGRAYHLTPFFIVFRTSTHPDGTTSERNQLF